jgi:sugar phosphate isomerase/epimerase
MPRVSRRSFLAATTSLAATGIGADKDARAISPSGSRRIPFRLGLVTYNLAAGWDLATILKVCQDVGISPVELRTTHKHGVEPSLPPDQRREVRKRFQDAGIDIWGCGTTCEFHSPDQAVVKRNIETCKQFVGLVHDLGGRGVKVRPNGLPQTVPVAKTLEQIGKALSPCGRAGADANVEIWVEVHGPGTSHPPHMRTIMEACGHPQVGLTWNSNQTDLKRSSVAEYFHLLRPWIRSCHINEIYKDSQKVYPYRELFSLFRTTGYDRVTLVEVARSAADPVAGAELLRYYKALWQELVSG